MQTRTPPYILLNASILPTRSTGRDAGLCRLLLGSETLPRRNKGKGSPYSIADERRVPELIPRFLAVSLQVT